MKTRVLVVDDEKNIRRMLGMILSGAGHTVDEAGSGEEALARLDKTPAHVVLLDVGLPGQDGIETLRQILSGHPGTAVIMISGQATVSMAMEATRLGAFDFIEKPLSKDHLLIAVRNALKVSSLGEVVDRYQRREARRNAMIGSSPVMVALRQQIEKVGPTGATVLITGESGSGKEIVARALHESSPRHGGPFVKVNCAAIPEDLIETELFGCIRGAYTGADRSRDGKFVKADGGTLFLDEIGDMSLRVQAKVLRALQEGEIERVGDTETQHVDVRVLAATNKDLPTEVEEGRFREDLYFRLNVIPLVVPALRQRTEDIPQLTSHFLELYAAENDLPVKRLSAAARDLLAGMQWRGNVRELRNVMERLGILSDGPTISDADVRALAPVGGSLRPQAAPAADRASAGDAWIPSLDEVRRVGGLAQARREFERRAIETCLEQTGGNITQAARWLGIERTNLHKKIQALGLDARRSPPPEEP